MTMVTVGITWAAVMADDAVAEDGMTVAIMTGDDAFAIDGRAAAGAVVHEATAGPAAIKRLRTGRCKNCKADGDGEEGDELFHDEWEVCFFMGCRLLAAFSSDGRPAACIRDESFFFSAAHAWGGLSTACRSILSWAHD